MPGETTYKTRAGPDELAVVWNLLRSFFEWFGEVGFFCGRVIHAAITPPYEFRELIRQLDEVGSKSALLVLLAGAAMGVVLSLKLETACFGSAPNRRSLRSS